MNHSSCDDDGGACPVGMVIGEHSTSLRAQSLCAANHGVTVPKQRNVKTKLPKTENFNDFFFQKIVFGNFHCRYV